MHRKTTPPKPVVMQTITSADWLRSMKRSRKQRNAVVDAIREKCVKKGASS